LFFLKETSNQGAKCSLIINLIYEEDLTAEPVHLIMVVAKDSKLVYDTEPGEVNNLESAKWKVSNNGMALAIIYR
jgi:hypothetical protein